MINNWRDKRRIKKERKAEIRDINELKDLIFVQLTQRFKEDKSQVTNNYFLCEAIQNLLRKVINKYNDELLYIN